MAIKGWAYVGPYSGIGPLGEGSWATEPIDILKRAGGAVIYNLTDKSKTPRFLVVSGQMFEAAEFA